MNGQRSRVVCIGEAAIELTRGADGRFGGGCGGDVYNTAIYLARAGCDVSFMSAVGDDPYSDSILALAAAEDVGTDLVLRAPGRLPALRLIEPGDERRTFCWDAGAPVRDLFELDRWERLAEGLLGVRLVYFSGITLSLFSNVGIGRFLALLEVARKTGTIVAFDDNFRPQGWKRDLVRARTVYIETLKRIDIALPTFEDEVALWGDQSPATTVDRLQAFGIAEVVVKNGAAGALVAAGSTRHDVPVPDAIEPIDMQAAGDGFNAGYIAARLDGAQPADAALAAHRLAAQVIRHPGAILPRAGAVMH